MISKIELKIFQINLMLKLFVFNVEIVYVFNVGIMCLMLMVQFMYESSY
jgi:hypothetical protein